MRTISESPRLLECLFGKTRRSILALLYGHWDESFHLRKILRLTNVSPGAGQRELKRLSDAGILSRTLRENQVRFQADPRCPIFEELKAIVTKTSGVADVLRTALGPLAGSIRAALLIGSVARGTATKSSDIDILIIGDAPFVDVVEKLNTIQDVLRREINPIVMSEAEFLGRAAEGDRFLTTALGGASIPLMGETDELVRLAQERVAPGA